MDFLLRYAALVSKFEMKECIDCEGVRENIEFSLVESTAGAAV